MININVNKTKAVLSTTVNGQDYIKEVKSPNIDSTTYEVIAILRNLSEALHILKKSDKVSVTLLGTDTVQNIVNASRYLKSQSYKNFNKKDGGAIFMKKEWTEVFSEDSLPLYLLRNDMIEFNYEYYYKGDSNYVGD